MPILLKITLSPPPPPPLPLCVSLSLLVQHVRAYIPFSLRDVFHSSKKIIVVHFLSITHSFDKFKENLLIFYLSVQIWTTYNFTYHVSVR